MMELFDAYAVQFQVLSHVALAMLLGGVVGVDREIADKPAGLRTHILVAGAAALLVSLGDVLVGRFDVEVKQGLVRSDPLRIIEAVVTGVSFLGAGTIIRQEASQHVHGLTTAASLLFIAAIGVTVALSQWVLAIALTVLVLVILRLLGLVSRWFGARRRADEIHTASRA
jgi:putative Mg2+ transporter-C (MgtC) family protein